MIAVLNEWIFHDLLGENGEDAHRETAEFFNLFSVSRDRLVLPDEPRWKEKAYRLMRLSDATLRNTCRQFHALILDSHRAMDARSLPPADVPAGLSVSEDDMYLVRAYLSSNADILVTTDRSLCEALADSNALSCQLRSQFLADYRIEHGA
jgi:hypothetical protein